MKEYKNDTSEEYDDMVGYVSEHNIKKTLSAFAGEEEEYKPSVKPKTVDPEFPEDWQNLFVNFSCEEDYISFMKLIGKKPLKKLRKAVYEKEENNGITRFMEDD